LISNIQVYLLLVTYKIVWSGNHVTKIGNIKRTAIELLEVGSPESLK